MAIHATAESTVTDPDDEPISTTVATAVADFKGIEPTELRTPLYDVVDVEALDALFARSSDGSAVTLDGYVRFVIDGCEVFVHSNGDVSVDQA